MATVTFERAVIAVMQKDDIASPHAAQAVNDPVGIILAPVVSFCGPHYNTCVSALPDHGIQLRTTITKGRAHPAGVLPGCGFDGLVATDELAPDISWQHKCEPRMRVCMIADHVAAV